MRDDKTIIENYKGKVDSISLQKNFATLDSLDFNFLQNKPYSAEDAAFFSLKIVFYNREAEMKGNLDNENQNRMRMLIGIIESQNLVKNRNRPFSTAKDVFIPAPPGAVESPEDLNAL